VWRGEEKKNNYFEMNERKRKKKTYGNLGEKRRIWRRAVIRKNRERDGRDSLDGESTF